MIIVLKDGSISEIGTYKELLDKKGAFSDFIMTHLQEASENDDAEGNFLKFISIAFMVQFLFYVQLKDKSRHFNEVIIYFFKYYFQFYIMPFLCNDLYFLRK